MEAGLCRRFRRDACGHELFWCVALLARPLRCGRFAVVSSVARMLRLLWRYWSSQPLRLASCVFLVMLMVFANLLSPVAAGSMVDEIVAIAAGHGHRSAAYRALALFAGASFTRLLAVWVRSAIWNRFAVNNMSALLDDAFERVQRFSTAWYENSFAGATVRKLTRGKWAYDVISDNCWLNLLEMVLVLIGLTAIMAFRFPVVALMFVLVAALFVVLAAVSALQYVRPAAERSALADSRIGASIADAIGNNAAIKAFGAEQRERALLSRVVGEWAELAYGTWQRGVHAATVQQLLWNLLQMAMIAVVIEQVVRAEATAGDVAFMLTACSQLGGYLNQIGSLLRQLQRSFSDFADIAEIDEQSPGIEDAPSAPALQVPAGEIVFDRVAFGYHAGVASIYNAFSLVIAPGEKVGLVGRSGSGKSTFVKLIQRLYDVDRGEIRIDGTAIHCVQQTSLRRAIAVVPQDPALFHRSLGENIAYGRPHASAEEIRQAARRARAAEFVERLPAGYDTLVGERGIKLSGGERQRVAIARAFLADAPIVIFDEATSSLDALTEQQIKAAMSELMEGRTTIVIAHRLSTVAQLDRILVFDAGRIVEQGTHKELMQRSGGHYRTLQLLQTEVVAAE